MFVKSVMKSMCEGFWPFDEGDWLSAADDPLSNYSSEEKDLKVIKAF